jgi:hypothetical protein
MDISLSVLLQINFNLLTFIVLVVFLGKLSVHKVNGKNYVKYKQSLVIKKGGLREVFFVSPFLFS